MRSRTPLPILVVLATVVAASACQANPTATRPLMIPTASPFVVRWTAQEVVEAFAATGLEVEGARNRGLEQDRWGAASTIVIELTSIETPAPDMGPPTVQVFAFGSAQDMARRLTQAHLNRNFLPSTWDSRTTPVVFGWAWVITRDNVVVDISSDAPQELAKQFEQALKAMR